ncbi:Trk system potassium transporter TrkA [Thiobacillus sp.]|uniref:Trk system potassium transporter TrkA n=1 Tax=Thiobacillus sp. TaxID=924 RepID=UPI0011D51EEF|nr:Trk system potassium transporter TrkA [Thiobacillus sp.]MBC2761090.1 Trk system potassium transporter TrkA [Thiobacillus sp.]MBD3810886.1 Trk system potassium transporter TrkA [Betaproteobacteria bacterium]TXH75022.1 MAG: Trk system potassium transporter TrkA [Thiobacillus sp.]
MKIIILGAGQVGANLAESLVAENNDITVIDLDTSRLTLLQDRFDLRTVRGHAAHPSVLKQAGAEDADMLVAVTQSDETNLVACRIASTLFNVPTRIARIRSNDFLGLEPGFLAEQFGVDDVISPEQEVTDTLRRLIEHPEALQVLDFAGGKVRLIAVRSYHGGPLVGHELQEIKRHMPDLECRIPAIYRRDHGIVPKGITVIEPGDEVFFLARKQDIPSVMRELRRMERRVKKVMIAGGGNIGRRLAAQIERDYDVKVIDHNKKVSNLLAEQLHHTLVLQGDATDEELLEQENIASMDVFCALTNDDEDNIMSALLAKRMGAHRVIALINRSAYVDLVQGGEIDIAISPAQATVGPLLSKIRRGDMVAVHSLRRGAAEVLEVAVHGDAKTSRVVGRRIEEIDLPDGATIAAIIRNNDVIIAHHDTLIEAEDHLIVFALNKRIIPKVEKLLQVGFGFF